MSPSCCPLRMLDISCFLFYRCAILHVVDFLWCRKQNLILPREVQALPSSSLLVASFLLLFLLLLLSVISIIYVFNVCVKYLRVCRRGCVRRCGR